MNPNARVPDLIRRGLPRRAFLADMGLGFTGLALGAMLSRDGVAKAAPAGEWAPPNGKPHFPPKAKNVIWLFMRGGVSHLESFDPKPEIDKYAGKTIEETPYKGVKDSPWLKANQRVVVVNDANGQPRNTLFRTQVGFKKYGRSGADVSDWFPHIGSCADDIAFIRGMWTTDDNHGAQVLFNSGRHMLDGLFPTIGAWVNYGLGTLNENLPQFISMGPRYFERRDAHYLGPAFESVEMRVDPKNPLAYARPELALADEEQRIEFDLLGKLNRLNGIKYPDDPVLAARRIVEQGVRFIQIFHGDGAAGAWDAHASLKANHSGLAAQVDQPVAGLLQDLKQRGLLNETIVVFATEFGRTPGAQSSDGRDHHIYGFTVWMAGGGIKGGLVHGATDELGFHAVEKRHYVTDIHATVLQQLGLDARRLEVPGRKRLDIDYGQTIREIIA